MSNTFIQLPAPSGNGSGAAVDVSALGALKTITVKAPQAQGTQTQVLVEYTNDPAHLVWQPLASFRKPGLQSVSVAANFLRATVSNYAGSPGPTVYVGAADETAEFSELVAPAGNGEGAGVDVSALPPYKTVQVNGTFKGVLNVEVSLDGGTTYSTIASFPSSAGTWSGILYVDYMRVSRSGITVRDTTPGLPTIYIGASEPPGAGGGGTLYPDITDDPGVQVDIAVPTAIVDGLLINANGIDTGQPLRVTDTSGVPLLLQQTAGGAKATYAE